MPFNNEETNLIFNIWRTQIKKIVGELNMNNDLKNVFITTLKYNNKAITSVKNITNYNIQLIDSEKSTKYTINYNVGGKQNLI